jgi:hypothetical protein
MQLRRSCSFWVRLAFVSCAAFVVCFLPVHGVAKTAALPHLSEATDATSQAAGGVAAVGAAGVASSSTNPAVFTDDGFRMWSLRTPETRVRILTADEEGSATSQSLLRRDGYALTGWRRTMSLGESTRFAAEVAFRASGRFTRVDDEGTALHAFPDTDWTLATTLARELGGQLSAGVTAKWLRTKYEDVESPSAYGHGWAFDVGFHYRQPLWRIGLVARNLSNGLSSLDPTRPRDPRHEVALGVGRTIALSSNVSLDLASDVRFPSRTGAQFAGGAALALNDDAGVTVGYRRMVERWRADVIDPNDGTTGADERLWIAEGVSYGVWVELGGWTISAAGSPVYLPDVEGLDRRLVDTSRWQWLVGLGRGR